MPEKALKAVYASGMDFEPDERRMTTAPDGAAEPQVSGIPCMIHAKIQEPLYALLRAMADSPDEGCRTCFMDFASEAVRTYTFRPFRTS